MGAVEVRLPTPGSDQPGLSPRQPLAIEAQAAAHTGTGSELGSSTNLTAPPAALSFREHPGGVSKALGGPQLEPR